MGGAVISANTTAPSSRTRSVSKSIGMAGSPTRCGRYRSGCGAQAVVVERSPRQLATLTHRSLSGSVRDHTWLGTRSQGSSRASSVIFALKSFEIGQPVSAASAALRKDSSEAPGTFAVSSRCDSVMLQPPSALSSVTVQVVREPLGHQVGLPELGRHSHREATGVGGGDELFGIGSLLFAEPFRERVGRVVQDAALRRHRALPRLEIALPLNRRLALHVLPPSVPWVAPLRQQIFDLHRQFPHPHARRVVDGRR